MKLSLASRPKLRKTEANEIEIKNIIYILRNRKKNNNLKLKGIEGGKKKQKNCQFWYSM